MSPFSVICPGCSHLDHWKTLELGTDWGFCPTLFCSPMRTHARPRSPALAPPAAPRPSAPQTLRPSAPSGGPQPGIGPAEAPGALLPGLSDRHLVGASPGSDASPSESPLTLAFWPLSRVWEQLSRSANALRACHYPGEHAGEAGPWRCPAECGTSASYPRQVSGPAFCFQPERKEHSCSQQPYFLKLADP